MTDMVQISIANLIITLGSDACNPIALAVKNPTDESGRKLQSLSAGPKFDEDAKRWLISEFAADPEAFVDNDARCALPENKVDSFMANLANDLFMSSDGDAGKGQLGPV